MATGLEKVVFIPIPKKGNVKECSNYCTIALISHASKVMLKILQARLQHIRAVTTNKPGGGNGNPLQYSCLENVIGRRAWLAAVDGVIKSQTRLSMHALMQQTKKPVIKKVDAIVF